MDKRSLLSRSPVVIIGAGPAGLIAAERLAAAGCEVHIYERKPSAARKFLMAGRGGLNITHSEEREKFLARYGAAAEWLRPMIADFTPADLRDWCAGLGEESFVGTSGRVFPRSFKASPLLRAWLARLRGQGVQIHFNHDWRGWDAAGDLRFADGAGREKSVRAAAVLLALGGASWPRLGADGGWIGYLAAKNVDIAPFVPANCGFFVDWSVFFRENYAGQPLKTALFTHEGETARGEAMIAEKGIEGGAVYALSAALRETIARDGRAVLRIDLRPGLTREALAARLGGPRGRDSWGNWLRKRAGLSRVSLALLREGADAAAASSWGAAEWAARIKDMPVTLTAPFTLERAISSAGGVRRVGLDDKLMLRDVPGVFVAGEMIDWEAPTGGYLLQACFATGVRAAAGVAAWLAR